jgi:hypothetical protein
MDIVRADSSRTELGLLNKIKIDIDVGVDNDFEIQTSTGNNCLNRNDYFYIEGSEYGGVVRDITVDTRNRQIKYNGPTFRGLLDERIIEPSSGQAYKVVSGDSASIITTLLAECDLDYIFVADTSASVGISSFKFNRYCSLLDGLNKMLKSVGHRLSISYQDGFCYLGAVAIVDRSDSMEFSEDGNVTFVITKKTPPTHMLCLGGGELEVRTVANLYLQADGSVGLTEHYTGKDKVTYLYDFVSSDDLEADGREKFAELLEPEEMEMNIEDIDVELYDIVGGREYITDTYLSREVTQKIVVIENDKMVISYKVGEK